MERKPNYEGDIYIIMNIKLNETQKPYVLALDSRLAYNGTELRAKSPSFELNSLMLSFALKINEEMDLNNIENLYLAYQNLIK